LKQRTKFINQFYLNAGEPFRRTMRQIEKEEPPFDSPSQDPYSDDGEPPFTEEWGEADMALDILGRTCISMLSGSLKLYLQTWEKMLPIEWEPKEREKLFKKGFVNGYRALFGEILKISWDDCPVDFGILEDVAEARNSDQHQDHITTMHVPLKWKAGN
jgi:hypothetical protein